jgi:hypothetical protein
MSQRDLLREGAAHRDTSQVSAPPPERVQHPDHIPVTASRRQGLMLGGPVATPAWRSIAWRIAITVVFAPLAARRYRHIG